MGCAATGKTGDGNSKRRSKKTSTSKGGGGGSEYRTPKKGIKKKQGVKKKIPATGRQD